MFMGKVESRNLSASEHLKLDQELWQALSALHRRNELKEILQCLYTESELIMFGRRIQIAKMLLEGWSVERIRKTLHCGIATVLAVDRCLKGQWSAYRTFLPSLLRENVKYGDLL